MFLILGLPLLMYPLFVGVGWLFLSVLKDKKLTVGIVGMEYLPRSLPDLAPVAGGLARAAQARDYPALLADGQFIARYIPEDPEATGGRLVVVSVPAEDKALLDSRAIDALVVVDPNLSARLERGDPTDRPVVKVLGRDGEENSKLAVQQVTGILRKWVGEVKAARFARAGLPSDYDSPVDVRDPQSDKSTAKKLADDLRDLLVKLIPLLLVLWVLTGAIYPAIDMTAGEKERGTMETLLISPAERSEIVVGKFLAVTSLGFGTAVWNIALMVTGVLLVQQFFPYPLLSVSGLVACTVAALPLAMLFAAGCLTLGLFARSTKEGNYYMVPMFFLVLPLAYWSMAPGIELDATMSWVPVTNALLLQQRLMSVRQDPFPWQHLPAVVISMVGCISLGLWAAVRQFRRESVLFREAEQGRGRWALFGKK